MMPAPAIAGRGAVATGALASATPPAPLPPPPPTAAATATGCLRTGAGSSTGARSYRSLSSSTGAFVGTSISCPHLHRAFRPAISGFHLYCLSQPPHLNLGSESDIARFPALVI